MVYILPIAREHTETRLSTGRRIEPPKIQRKKPVVV